MRKVFEENDETRCRQCGAKLSLLQRLSRQEFCSPEHRSDYQKEQESLALARLQQSSLSIEPPTRLLSPAPDEPAGSSPAPADPPQAWFADLSPEPSAARRPIQSDDMEPEPLPPLWTAGTINLAPEHAKWEPAGGGGFEDFVTPARGDVFTILELDPIAQETEIGPRFAVPIAPLPFEWPEAEGRSEPEDGPPLARLLPLAGPQTLRFVPVLARPEPQAVASEALPARLRWSVTGSAARTRSVPMAERVRPSWKTRFGQAGYLNPRMLSGASEPIPARTGGVTRPRCGFGMDPAHLPAAMRAASLVGSQLRRADLCRIGHEPLDYKCVPELARPADFDTVSVTAAAKWLAQGLEGWLPLPVETRRIPAGGPRPAPDSWINTIDGPPDIRLVMERAPCALSSGELLPADLLMDGVRAWGGSRTRVSIAAEALAFAANPVAPDTPAETAVTLRRASRIDLATAMAGEWRMRSRLLAPTDPPEATPAVDGIGLLRVETRSTGRQHPRSPAPAEVLFPLPPAELRDMAAKVRNRQDDFPPDESWTRLASGRFAGWAGMSRKETVKRAARLPAPLGETRVPLDAFDTEVEPSMEPLTCSFDSGGGSWDSLI